MVADVLAARDQAPLVVCWSSSPHPMQVTPCRITAHDKVLSAHEVTATTTGTHRIKVLNSELLEVKGCVTSEASMKIQVMNKE